MTDPDLTPRGFVTETPFFFIILPSFIARTGMMPIPELHVATQLKFHAPVLEKDAQGTEQVTASSFLVKMLGIDQQLLITSKEMHPICSHTPDGICRHKLDEHYLSAEQILFMVECPLHNN